MKSDAGEKSGLHSRNPHRFRYDFPSLIDACADLAPFVHKGMHGHDTIDFADDRAVKALNRALLFKFYDITDWDIPDGYLCPPIPGRADYIHHTADLLSGDNDGEIPKGSTVTVLDIGVGANCVYPIIGRKAYLWRFVGTDVDFAALESARRIVASNRSLNGSVEIRAQDDLQSIFRGTVSKGELFDLAICNPPFHSSIEEASSRTLRKVNNLRRSSTKTPQKEMGEKLVSAHLNFGGQHGELVFPGGELTFIGNMIIESVLFRENFLWFTSLVSRKENLGALYHLLRKNQAVEVKTIDMAQGQKISRIIAWTFKDVKVRAFWGKTRWH